MNHDPICDYSPVVINDIYVNYGVCTCDYINAARVDERTKMKNNFLFYSDIRSMSDQEFEVYLDTVREVERENAASRLANIVYEALGEASMAWSEIPGGVFDSDKCVVIAEKLIAVVKNEYMI